MCHFSLGKGRGHERGGEQMRRRWRGVGRTRKRDAERNCMAPRGQGAVAVRIFTGFSISDPALLESTSEVGTRNPIGSVISEHNYVKVIDYDIDASWFFLSIYLFIIYLFCNPSLRAPFRSHFPFERHVRDCTSARASTHTIYTVKAGNGQFYSHLMVKSGADATRAKEKRNQIPFSN